MKTQHLDANSAADCRRARELLAQGELVAVPTETVYGLAADATQPDAVAAIFAAKQRPANHPLIVHIAGVEQLERWARPVPPAAIALAAAFWPGPLTLLLSRAPGIDTIVTGGRDTIGLRVPDHPVLLALLRDMDTGLAAPSANLHKKLSPTSAEQVLAGLDGRIAAVLDGGPCRVGLESTIVDLTGSAPRILRSGPISRQQIEAVLGCAVELPVEHDVAVPGNMQVHYQPRSPLHLLTREALVEALHSLTPRSTAVILHDQGEPALEQMPLLAIQVLPGAKESYASALYRTLHEMDRLHPARILLERPPQDESWADVNDRLARASSPF